MVLRIPPLINVGGRCDELSAQLGDGEVGGANREHSQWAKAAGWCNGLQGIYEATV